MIYDQLIKDYTSAMKAKEEPKKTELNFILAQIKNKKIELKRDPNDDEVIAILKKEVKALNETITFLEKANKPTALAEEQKKKDILEKYLPVTLDKEQTKKLIESLIAELGITDLRTGRGLLMKELMAQHKNQLDNTLVNTIINEML